MKYVFNNETQFRSVSQFRYTSADQVCNKLQT